MEGKAGNILIVIGFIGGCFTEWLAGNEAAIQSAFYLASTAVLLGGFGFKIYDRINK